jgi:hypothetical protein
MEIKCYSNEHGIRCELYVDQEYEGVLYFERAKSKYIRKPIMGGWVCVDAKISEGLYSKVNITPTQLIDACYKEFQHSS